MHNSLLLKCRLQKAPLAQPRLSQILLAGISLQGNIERGEERGLCPGRHCQVQSSTSQVREASPTCEYAFCFPLGCFLPSSAPGHFFFIIIIFLLIKDMQRLLWVTAAAAGVSSPQQEQLRVSVCISAVRDCLHTPWQAPRVSPKPQFTSNHFHSRLLRLS